MKWFVGIPLWWLLTSTSFIARGHEDSTYYHVRMLREQEGLSNQLVTALLQDQRGFLWVGTADGLNRYDGYGFRVFRHQKGDRTSLGSNKINCLFEDRQGVLWVGTDQGLSRLDPATNSFTSFRFGERRPQTLSHPEVRAVLRDHRGTLWVATVSGLNRLDEKKGTFTRFFPGQAATNPVRRVRNNFIVSLFEDPAGALWLGTQHGLFRFDPATGRFRAYMAQADSLIPHSYTLANTITSVTGAGDHALWVGTWSGGLQWVDTQSGERKTFWYNPARPYTSSENIVFHVVRKSTREWWVSTAERGLAIFNDSTRQFTFLPVDARLKEERRLPAAGIHTVLCDRRGLYWIGTAAGLARLVIHPPLFHYHPLPDQRDQVWDGYQNPADGHWYLAVYGPNGWLYEFDPRPGTFMTHPFARSPYFRWMGEPVRDQRGMMWLPTGGPDHPELWQFDPVRKKMTLFRQNPRDTVRLKGIVFREVREDARGNLWLMSKNDGLFHYNRNTRLFRRLDYRSDAGNTPFNPVSSMLINQRQNVCIDRRGDVWVAYRSGLRKLDATTQRWTDYTLRPNDFFVPGSVTINTLAEDRAGYLWAGTASHGLVRIDPATPDGRNTKSYTVEEGLPSNQIHDLVLDKEGIMWLATSSGLCRFETRTGRVRTYTDEDGLKENNLVYGLSLGADGTLLIGGQGGFLFAQPEALQTKPLRVPLAWTSFKVLNEEHTPSISVGGTREIVLPHWKNLISAEFASLCYEEADKVRYAYRLEGLDHEWIPTGKRRFVSYANLASGKYVLRIRATLLNDAETAVERALPITILPPWWRTWWAYAGYGLIVLGTVLAARRTVIRRERLKADLRVKGVEAGKLKEMAMLKSHFFANISHEFRTPLSLITGTTETLQEDDGKPHERRQHYRLIHRHAARLLQLVNQLLDLSRLETGGLKWNSLPGDFARFLGMLAQAFTSLAEHQRILYRYQLPASPVWLAYDADKLEKILTNLLFNAFKFTPEGGEVALDVRVEPIDQAGKAFQVQLTVRDTGQGISPEALPRIFERFYQGDASTTRLYEGSGIGLSLTKELVELQGGTIRAESHVGKGTTMTVKLTFQAAMAVESSPVVLTGKAQSLFEELREDLAMDDSSHGEEKYRTKILVVEDNRDLRRFIRNSLSKNYAILEADNGEAGLNTAIETMPDLVISDVMMPGMDGMSLCKKIKADERTCHIPVLLLTARADQESKMEGLETGADDYLTKPFQVRELVVRVHNQIESRKRLRERYAREMAPGTNPEIPLPSIASADEKFLQRAAEVTEKFMSNPDFDVERFGEEMNLSRTQLYRKLYALTDQSPSDFIRQYRLGKAGLLLAARAASVSEIAYRVGFREHASFTRSFSKHFGVSPSEYTLLHAPQH